jgi:hypothetical protein
VPLLEELVPDYDVRERHRVALPVTPERALEVALASPAAPEWVVRALLRLRGIGASRGSLEEFATTAPFRELARSDTEFVAGLSPGRLSRAIAARARA